MRGFNFSSSNILRLLALSLCFGVSIVCRSQYTLTVEASPAWSSELGTTNRFYVNMENETDEMSAVYGSYQAPLFINVPEGVFNSPFNQSWNASESTQHF